MGETIYEAIVQQSGQDEETIICHTHYKQAAIMQAGRAMKSKKYSNCEYVAVHKITFFGSVPEGGTDVSVNPEIWYRVNHDGG